MEIKFFNVMHPLQEHTINVIRTGIQTYMHLKPKTTTFYGLNDEITRAKSKAVLLFQWNFPKNVEQQPWEFQNQSKK